MQKVAPEAVPEAVPEPEPVQEAKPEVTVKPAVAESARALTVTF